MQRDRKEATNRLTKGKPYTEARDILSQELGHFRGDIVEIYLR